MRLGAFTVDVIVDGKALEQYDVVNESPTKATCWIPSEVGKLFSVKWTCHEKRRVLGAQGSLSVDGISCACHSMLPEGPGECVISRLILDAMERDLMFSPAVLSDDDSLLKKSVPKELGEVHLTVKRGKLVRERYVAQMGSRVLDDHKFHERSKKATVHCVGFGPEVPRKLYPYYYRLDPSGDPPLTFVFKYQSLGMLQANGIAPLARSASNSSIADLAVAPTEHDVGTASNIKPAQLAANIQRLENELKRLRDLQGGISESEEQKPKRIKTEERKGPSFAHKEIIDLT